MGSDTTTRKEDINVTSTKKYWRLYADDAGESHFEEVETKLTPVVYAPPAPPLDISDPTEAARYIMLRFPPGWADDAHPSPRRQLCVFLSGELEGTTSDGTAVTFTPGDCVLMEDTYGKGHGARVIGTGDATAILVHLE